jgi:hypothetical protein
VTVADLAHTETGPTLVAYANGRYILDTLNRTVKAGSSVTFTLRLPDTTVRLLFVDGTPPDNPDAGYSDRVHGQDIIHVV